MALVQAHCSQVVAPHFFATVPQKEVMSSPVGHRRRDQKGKTVSLLSQALRFHSNKFTGARRLRSVVL